MAFAKSQLDANTAPIIPDRPTLRDDLRSATGADHAILDHSMAGLRLAEPADLLRFLGIHLAARVGIEAWLERNALPGWVPPAQTGLIAQDLIVLGGLPAAFPAPRFEPSPAAAWLGPAHVIAGSHLGNRLLLAQAGASLPANAQRFLAETAHLARRNARSRWWSRDNRRRQSHVWAFHRVRRNVRPVEIRSGVKPAQPTTLDLDSCANEPIHIPGRIQSFGALIAVSSDWLIAHCSQNLGQFLGLTAQPQAGQPLSQHVGAPLMAALRRKLQAIAASNSVERSFGEELTPGGPRFDIALHVSGRTIVIEFERHAPSEYGHNLAMLRPLMARLERARDLFSPGI